MRFGITPPPRVVIGLYSGVAGCMTIANCRVNCNHSGLSLVTVNKRWRALNKQPPTLEYVKYVDLFVYIYISRRSPDPLGRSRDP